jgi:hypothetical protein
MNNKTIGLVLLNFICVTFLAIFSFGLMEYLNYLDVTSPYKQLITGLTTSFIYFGVLYRVLIQQHLRELVFFSKLKISSSLITLGILFLAFILYGSIISISGKLIVENTSIFSFTFCVLHSLLSTLYFKNKEHFISELKIILNNFSIKLVS